MAGLSSVDQRSLRTVFDRGRYEQVGYAEAKPFSNQVKSFHGGIGLAPFEMAHVGPVQAYRKGESLLGVAGFRAKAANDLAEALEQVG